MNRNTSPEEHLGLERDARRMPGFVCETLVERGLEDA